MSNPLAIIADAIHNAECGCGKAGFAAENAAHVAAKALTDPAIVAHATEYVKARWHLAALDDDLLRCVIRDTLASVAREV